MRSNLLLACILALAQYAATAQSMLNVDDLAEWHPSWRFSRVSDSLWTDVDFDDSGWDELPSSSFDPGFVDSATWHGFGWFRTTFAVDSSLSDRPLGFSIATKGALALFLDGRPLAQFGTPGRSISSEESVRLTSDNPGLAYLSGLSPGRHVIAAEASNFRFSDEGETEFGFDLAVDRVDVIASTAARRHELNAAKIHLVVGITAALALIYLLLFILQPKQARNGLFGLLAALASVVAYSDLHSQVVTDADRFILLRRLVGLGAIAGWLVVLRIVRLSFFKEPWRLFYPIVALGGLVALHAYFDPVGAIWSVSVFSALAAIELLRRIGLAVFLSRPGAWMVAVGAVLFAVTAVHDYLGSMGWMDPAFGLSDMIHFGIAGFLVLFAAFLGTEFTRANRTLEARVVQVRQEADDAMQEEKANQAMRIERIQAELDHRRKEFEQLKDREVDDIRRSMTVTEQQLIQTREKLVRLEDTAGLGKLAVGIAHDVESILDGIEELSTLSKDLVADLQRSKDGGRAPEDLLRPLRNNIDRILEQTQLAEEVVGDIVAHSRSESVEEDTVDVNELIERYLNLTLHGARGEFPEADFLVERELDDRAGTVAVAPVLVGRALMGIFRNAVESVAMHAKDAGDDFQPTITVSSQRLDHAVLIRVRDNGPGVPQDLRDRIFEPFFSTKGSQPGLGLSIAHKIIVEDLKGTFGLEHFKEQGAGFYITIPFSKFEDDDDVPVLK